MPATKKFLFASATALVVFGTDGTVSRAGAEGSSIEFADYFAPDQKKSIRFHFWQASDELISEFMQADKLGLLANYHEENNLFEVDLFILGLNGWADIENLPEEYSALQPDLSDFSDGVDAVSLTIDYSVAKNSTRPPFRVHLINVEELPENFPTLECLALRIQESALKEFYNFAWSNSYCIDQ